MDKKLTTFFALVIIVAFIGYMIYDSVKPAERTEIASSGPGPEEPAEMWKVEKDVAAPEGILKAVSVGEDGKVYAGGNSFIACFDRDLNRIWAIDPGFTVSALAVRGDTIIAATAEQLMVLDKNGRVLGEWGPFEEKCMITSVAINNRYVAFSDAANRIVFVLDRKGAVVSMMGQNNDQFIVPSPYFDVALDGSDNLYVANTGHRRLETRKISGEVIAQFGEPGTAPEAFCGCCNPAHFTIAPGGFITAEKGINRIKVMTGDGKFREYVSSADRFMASVPLDIATYDGIVLYAANPADSKLYMFIRKYVELQKICLWIDLYLQKN
ncbi:MAG: hypothetical protein MUD02_05250 [Bacteroidales bacterium]|nr:hypothetical protein [Bacteroidales bacterium]